MLTQNKSRMVGPYIPIWNRQPSRDDARKVVSWTKGGAFPHIRIQLKDSQCVQKSIRNVLVPTKELALIDTDTIQPKCPRRNSLTDVVNRQKQRLRIKYGIGVRNDEFTKRKIHMNNEDDEMLKLENIVGQKYLDFECMCKDTNDAATKALREAEYWTRQRSKLQRPTVLLEREVTAIRTNVTKQENRLEMLNEFKNFINLFFYNLTNANHWPISKNEFMQLPYYEDFANSVSLKMIGMDEGRFFIQETLHDQAVESPVRDTDFPPNVIENELENLETRNLHLIENWQVSADDLDDTVHRQFTVITKLNNRLSDIKAQLEMTRAEMERCTLRSEEFELYCRLFDGEQNGLFTEDEILKDFKRKIRRLYNFVTDSFTMNIEVDALTMLTTVESRLIDLITTEENLDPNKVRDVQRDIERQRRNELHEQKQKHDEMERLARNQRAHERSMQTQKVKRGRRLIKRSAKPYQRKKALVNDKKFNTDEKDDETYYFSNTVWKDQRIIRDSGKVSDHSSIEKLRKIRKNFEEVEQMIEKR